jgi:hypothetical protein
MYERIIINIIAVVIADCLILWGLGIFDIIKIKNWLKNKLIG